MYTSKIKNINKVNRYLKKINLPPPTYQNSGYGTENFLFRSKGPAVSVFNKKKNEIS